MARLAAKLVGLLSGSHNWKVQLYRDPALPALEQGNTLLRAGRFVRGLEIYDAAVKQAQASKLAAASLAHAQYSRGIALVGLGRHAEALAALKQRPPDQRRPGLHNPAAAAGAGAGQSLEHPAAALQEAA